MTAHVPNAERQAHLVAQLEQVEAAVKVLLRLEETECREYERLRQERSVELCRLSRRVELLRHAICPREDVT